MELRVYRAPLNRISKPPAHPRIRLRAWEQTLLKPLPETLLGGAVKAFEKYEYVRSSKAQ